jgi:hypothetical protein
MSTSTPARIERPWKQIAEEITSENDPGKMLGLIEELNRALAQQLSHRPMRTSVSDDYRRSMTRRIS